MLAAWAVQDAHRPEHGIEIAQRLADEFISLLLQVRFRDPQNNAYPVAQLFRRGTTVVRWQAPRLHKGSNFSHRVCQPQIRRWNQGGIDDGRLAPD